MKSESTASAPANESGSAMVRMPVKMSEIAEAHGKYFAQCIGPREGVRDQYIALREQLWAFEEAGNWIEHARIASLMTPMEEVKWDDTIDNLVTTAGKNLALDTFLAGSAYTVVGPYIGLINTNASAAAITDTMASHAGWLEVGGANVPLYTAPRKTAAWSAAASGSKALSSALSFGIITTGGTVGGCFLVFGTGALSTIDNTAGTLYSAGAFSGGSKTVAPGDTLTVSYTASL